MRSFMAISLIESLELWVPITVSRPLPLNLVSLEPCLSKSPMLRSLRPFAVFNPGLDEAVPVPSAPEPTSARTAGRYRSPIRCPSARSFPAARRSLLCERCARRCGQTEPNGSTLHAESAIGRVLSYGSPFTGRECCSSRRKKTSHSFSKVVKTRKRARSR